MSNTKEKLTVLYNNPHDSVVNGLRELAQQIEDGNFGEAWAATLVIDAGGSIKVLTAGPGQTANLALAHMARGTREILRILDNAMDEENAG